MNGPGHYRRAEQLLGHAAAMLDTDVAPEDRAELALARALHDFYSGPRRQLAIDRLGRAQQAGQLRADLDLAAVVDQLWGACYHRMLLFGEPVEPAMARVLVTNLLYGIASPAGNSGRTDSP